MKCTNITLFTFLIQLANAIRVQLWKRAGEGLIDLNKTPSPENSIDLNNPLEPVPEDTAGSIGTSKTPKLKPKRKRNPTRFEKLREAYNNRDNLGEKERIEVENNFQKFIEIRREQDSLRKKSMWERIRTGKATERDLRKQESCRKGYEKWRKLNPERVKAYKRKYYKKIKSQGKKKKS